MDLSGHYIQSLINSTPSEGSRTWEDEEFYIFYTEFPVPCQQGSS